MTTIQQLSYIVKISEAGSINKASEILYVAQPSLTSSVQEVEKEVGFKIFHRSGRGVSLTPEGAEFVLYARQVINQYELLMERFGKAENVKRKFGACTLSAIGSNHLAFCRAIKSVDQCCELTADVSSC